MGYSKPLPSNVYEALEVKTAFKDLLPRMSEYGFEEGKEYTIPNGTHSKPSINR